jgi:carbonic anhydrase
LVHIPESVRTDDKYRDLLITVDSSVDIPAEWQNTPIAALIIAQNFGWPIQASGKAELLIATCIEFRYALPVPRMYAYVIRRASGRVIGSEFSVGYTLAHGVKYLVLIGHNDCGMSKLVEKAPLVVNAFVEQGWSRDAAEEYVAKQAKRHSIDDELGALKEEYLRLRKIFPRIVIAPLFVCLHDSRLYIPKWVLDSESDTSSAITVPSELIAELP